MQLSLQQIEDKVKEYTHLIHTPEDLIPTFGYSKQSGLPHIELDEGIYHLIVLENGEQLSKESTHDPDELLFMIMFTITLSMACERISRHTNYKSFRMRLFEAQKNIISKISLSYMSRIKMKHESMQNQFVLS